MQATCRLCRTASALGLQRRLQSRFSSLLIAPPSQQVCTPAWGVRVRLKHGKAKAKARAKGDKRAAAEEEEFKTLDEIADMAEVRVRMERCLAGLQNDFAGFRAGKVDANMFSHLKVDAYGIESEMSSVGQVSVQGTQLVVIKVYDPGLAAAVADAVSSCDMDLYPQIEGSSIKVAIPRPTKETRDKMVKLAGKAAEQTRQHVRGIRQKVNDQIGKHKASFSADDVFQKKKELDDLTKEIDAAAALMLGNKRDEIQTG